MSDTINLEIIDNNKTVDVEFLQTIESNLILHDASEDSHPAILSQLNQFSTNTNLRLDGIDSAVVAFENKDSELETLINQNKNGDEEVAFLVATPTSSNHAANKEYVDSAQFYPNVVTGLGLSATSSILTVAVGFSMDSANSKKMALSAPLSKTLSTFVEGNGNGCLDASGTLVSKTFYVYLIAKSDLQADVLISLSDSSPTMPSGFSYQKLIGVIATDAAGAIVSFSPNKDVQSAYSLGAFVDASLSNLSSSGKNVVTDLVIPNYASGATKAVNTTYTAASNVLVVVQGTSTATGSRINILVAGSTIQSMGDGNGAYSNMFGTIEALVPKGSTYQITTSGSVSVSSIKEYPLKGAN